MKTFLTIYILCFSLLIAGCPKQTDIASVKKNSARVAAYANLGVDLTRELYRANLISNDDAQKIARAWVALSKAGIAFDGAVRRAEQEFNNAVPKSEVEKLFIIFNAEVVEAFIAVLSAIKPNARAGEWGKYIEAIKTAVLLTAKTFQQRAPIEARIAEAQ